MSGEPWRLQGDGHLEDLARQFAGYPNGRELMEQFAGNFHPADAMAIRSKALEVPRLQYARTPAGLAAAARAVETQRDAPAQRRAHRLRRR